jgi:hypothetical protein
VTAVKHAADADVANGTLLPEDRVDAIRKAEAFDGPWAHGTCYTTYSQDANETGPLSGALAGEAYDPTLPLSTGPTMHEVNCNVIAANGG